MSVEDDISFFVDCDGHLQYPIALNLIFQFLKILEPDLLMPPRLFDVDQYDLLHARSPSRPGPDGQTA